MSRRILMWLCLMVPVGLFGAVHATAQEGGTIRGQVRSVEGGPIAAVQVYLEGQSFGSITGVDGRYTINNVPAGTYTVIAQVIGYETGREEGVSVAAGAPVDLDFALQMQVMALDEIVVTGVAEATSRALVPFTVGRVGTEEIPIPPANALGALQGRVAGANIIQGSQPGSGVSIMLRSPTSINRENAPLLVVDGVIGANSADLSTLDIESIEVIKGAAAASLYGSRAASGVVQIRTRRGSSLPRDETRISVRSEFGNSDIPHPIAWATHHPFQLNSQGQFLDNDGNVVPRGLAAANRFAIQDQRYPGEIYDHIGSLFNPGQYTTNSATFGHNGGSTSWLATVSDHREAGVVRENRGYQRNDFRLNLDHQLRDDFRIALSGFHMRSDRENLYGNVFFDFVQLSPDVNLLVPDEDGTPYAFQPDESGIRPNPLYMLATQDREARRLRTMGSADLRYNPTPWLAFDVTGSYDRSDRRTDVYIPKGVKTSNAPTGDPGYASRTTGIDDQFNGSAGLALTRSFGQLNTRTYLRGSYESSDTEVFEASGDIFSVGGIPGLDALQTVAIGSEDETVRTTGYLLNSDLNYDERYIVSGLLRRDGSSVFGPEDRWHTYYRGSAAYRMAEEAWWPFADVNEFKLRYSIGTAGGRPDFADQYEVFSIVSGGGVALSSLGNRFLRPEKSTEQEMGLDVVAFNRYSLQLTYATQTTTDQLVQVPLPSLFGFSSQWQNAGTVEGNSWEAQLEARLIQRPGLRWSATLIADRSRNQITEYDRPCHNSGLGYRCAGEWLGVIYSQKFLRGTDDLGTHLGGVHTGSAAAWDVNEDGLLVPVGAGNSFRDGISSELWGTSVSIDGESYPWGMPVRLLDESGNPVRVQTGDSNPSFRWGISNQVEWRNFSFFGLVDSQVGGHIYNATKQRMYQHQRHGEQDQHNEPDELKKPIAYYAGFLYNANSDIDWFVEDASYVKLRELSVRYRFDPTRLSGLTGGRVGDVSLSLIGRNLLTFTDYTGYDPDIGSTTNREDSFDYPVYRTLSASVEISF